MIRKGLLRVASPEASIPGNLDNAFCESTVWEVYQEPAGELQRRGSGGLASAWSPSQTYGGLSTCKTCSGPTSPRMTKQLPDPRTGLLCPSLVTMAVCETGCPVTALQSHLVFTTTLF